MRKSSLRSRLILGFSLVTVPLFLLLISNNWYAMGVVQKQVAGSNKNLVTMNMNQIDQKLTEAEKYLLKTSLQDPNVLSLDSYPEDSEEAVYAKVNTFNRLSQDIPFYADMDAFFAYGAGSRELIFAAQQSLTYSQKEAIRAKLSELLGDPGVRQSYVKQWMIVPIDGEYALMRVLQADEGSFIGVWVNLNRFLSPFHRLDMGDEDQVLIAASDGRVLAHEPGFSAGTGVAVQLKHAFAGKDRPYRLLDYGDDRSKGMMVSQQSQMADIHLVVLRPVRSLLEQLPLFQWFIYLTPALVLAMLLLFLLYIQRFVTLPVHRLLKGMRQMRAGNFRTRLEPSRLAEFNDINVTFNQMSDEIETLKIDIYEEKIKTHRAELKHLQAQIHPHFFTNCLNLIYNLAQVKNIGLVQKLTLHLVQHLRFTIRTNVASVPLREELKHIQNYLSIQKLRFPQTFEYRMEVLAEMQRVEIPPLTIQPFVENAMEHGFSYGDDEPFRIGITMEVERPPDAALPYLAVKIADNGAGFEPSVLAKLQSGEYFSNEFDEHIGIWNVHRRCQLYYRAGTTIVFANNPRGGAEVTLKLPLEQHVPEEETDVPSLDR